MSYISLPYVYNIKNPIHLINDLNEIPINQDLKFTSFDISNMYSNIPTTSLIHIITTMCDQQNLPSQIKHEILSVVNIKLEQNYFSYQNTIYIQTEGLAMGAPTSALFSEIYLQYLKDTSIFNILVQHHITGYFRFVDNIFIIYKPSLTNIHELLHKFNNMTPKLNFTLE
jgi:hypothetical protein